MSCSIVMSSMHGMDLDFNALEDLLTKNKKLLCLVPEYEYFVFNTHLIYHLVNERGMSGACITMNTSGDVLFNMLNAAHVRMEEVYIIDCVLRSIGGAPRRKGRCFFVDSPTDLLGIGIALTEISERIKGFNRKKFLFFDSLTLRGMLNALQFPSKVAHFIEQRCLLACIDIAILSVERESDKNTIKAMRTIADETLQVASALASKPLPSALSFLTPA